MQKKIIKRKINMSASLVRKSLEIVDPGSHTNTGHRKKAKRKQGVFGLIPENHKHITKKAGKNAKKINLLSTNSKLTVTEARQRYKSKEQILKDNLKKLEIIKKASTINVEKAIVNQIIERAVTRRPVNIVQKLKKKKEKKTVFTEEDFKKFEEEYINE